MPRVRFVAVLLPTAWLGLAACGGPSGGQGPTPAPVAAPFSIVETDIATLQQALQSGRVTSRQLTERYLERIATYEDRLNAIITVNPRAIAEAEAMDKERAAGKVRGPLHGIPIALKDNIHTTDIRTTGGALAFRDLVPPYDATLTRNLRDGGAVIIAKTVLTELAHWTAGAPTPMVANYTGVAGFAYNPYDPRMDPRDGLFDGRPVLATGGSSSGAGTAASFWAASVGSDTGGSIISPSNANMLVGIRPTIGRISRYGVIPITADHDTAGPMARTVRDAAILMGVLESAAPDANDAATKACTPPANRDYTAVLDAGALKGARIGVPRAFYIDPITAPGEKTPRGGLNPDQAKVMADAIALLKAQGAEVVDPADVPSIVAPVPADNFLLFDYCQGAEHKKGGDANCTVNFKYGMKRDFNAWLASLGPAAPVQSLTELRQWNLAHAKADSMRFGQSRLDISDEMDVERDKARNEADMAKDNRLSRDQGIDAVLKTHKLDAILTPGGTGANLTSRAGYPIVVVPFGLVPNTGNLGAAPGAPTTALPAGFDAKSAPFGVAFTGTACTEPRLIALAYAFEQASKKRVPPPDMP
jgi:amidase